MKIRLKSIIYQIIIQLTSRDNHWNQLIHFVFHWNSSCLAVKPLWWTSPPSLNSLNKSLEDNSLSENMLVCIQKVENFQTSKIRLDWPNSDDIIIYDWNVKITIGCWRKITGQFSMASQSQPIKQLKCILKSDSI